MKHMTAAGKAFLIIFAIVLAGCSGTDTKPTDGKAKAQEAVARAMEESRVAKARRQRIQQKAMDAAGNVVYFDFDRSTLRAGTRRVLDAHIAVLRNNSKDVRLEGHADERGTREYNIALGERRAKAAASYMTVKGIASYRIDIISYGEERPVVIGSDEASWQRNRRVEIVH